jgi:hypothetical protein
MPSDLGPELLRVAGHALGELAAEDGLEAGVILDELGVEELSSRDLAFEQQRPEHAAAGIHGGAQPGRAPADDDGIEVETGWRGHCVRAFGCPSARSPAARSNHRFLSVIRPII